MSPRRIARPPARCLALLARLSRYLDNEMTPRERRAIDAHCRACHRCRRMLTTLRGTIDLCRAAGTVPLPASVRTRAAARVARLLRRG